MHIAQLIYSRFIIEKLSGSGHIQIDNTIHYDFVSAVGYLFLALNKHGALKVKLEPVLLAQGCSVLSMA